MGRKKEKNSERAENVGCRKGKSQEDKGSSAVNTASKDVSILRPQTLSSKPVHNTEVTIVKSVREGWEQEQGNSFMNEKRRKDGGGGGGRETETGVMMSVGMKRNAEGKKGKTKRSEKSRQAKREKKGGKMAWYLFRETKALYGSKEGEKG